VVAAAASCEVTIRSAQRDVKRATAGPVPYRLDYVLETAPGFVTSRRRVGSRGEGVRRTLALRRDASTAFHLRPAVLPSTELVAFNPNTSVRASAARSALQKIHSNE
jgi:hypothetical protein